MLILEVNYLKIGNSRGDREARLREKKNVRQMDDIWTGNAGFKHAGGL